MKQQTDNRPLEKDKQAAILKHLRKLGIFCWRNNSGFIPIREGHRQRRVAVGQAGLPDILGYLSNGLGFGIEVKRDKDSKASETQFEKIKKLKETGVPVFVAYDLEVVQFVFDDPLLRESRLWGACESFLAGYKHKVRRSKHPFDPELPFL